MQKRFLATVLESPIVGVAVFGASFGFFLLPVLFSNSEKAAEFWGSFLAAITGAAALLAGAWYQDRLTRKREHERIQNDALTDALRLYLWLGWCNQRYRRASERCELIIEQIKKGVPPTKPLNYGTYRTLLSPVVHSEADGKVEIISRLPAPLAETIFPILAIISEHIDFRNKDVMSDDTPLDQRGFEFHAEQFRNMCELIAVGKSRLARFLRENGIGVLLSEDEHAAKIAVEKFRTQIRDGLAAD